MAAKTEHYRLAASQPAAAATETEATAATEAPAVNAATAASSATAAFVGNTTAGGVAAEGTTENPDR